LNFAKNRGTVTPVNGKARGRISVTRVEEEMMTPEPKIPSPTEHAKEASAAPRRKYTSPRLKCLGSVRDLTLGSPIGLLMDGLPGGMRTM
jgi:hypothetical protein